MKTRVLSMMHVAIRFTWGQTQHWEWMHEYSCVVVKVSTGWYIFFSTSDTFWRTYRRACVGSTRGSGRRTWRGVVELLVLWNTCRCISFQCRSRAVLWWVLVGRFSFLCVYVLGFRGIVMLVRYQSKFFGYINLFIIIVFGMMCFRVLW